MYVIYVIYCVIFIICTLYIFFFFFLNLFEGLLKQWSYAPDDSDYMLHLQVTFMYILFWRWG